MRFVETPIFTRQIKEMLSEEDYRCLAGKLEVAVEIGVIQEKIGDRLRIGLALNNLGGIYLRLGEYAEASSYYEQALLVQREIGYRRSEGIIRFNQGICALALGDHVESKSLHEKALRIHREHGNRRSEGLVVKNLGIIARALGDYPQAMKNYEEALCISQESILPVSECTLILLMVSLSHLVTTEFGQSAFGDVS